MATDPLDHVRAQVGLRLSEIRDAASSLSPLDLYARLDATTKTNRKLVKNRFCRGDAGQIRRVRPAPGCDRLAIH